MQKIQKNTKIQKSKAETRAAIRRDHKQTIINRDKKLSNFLDIKGTKNTEENENTKKQSRDYGCYQERPHSPACHCCLLSPAPE